MSKRTPQLLLDDILTSCERILDYTKNLSYDEFEADNKTVDAVIRKFDLRNYSYPERTLIIVPAKENNRKLTC